MNKKFTLREFPLDEIDMLNSILTNFKNWDYINIEQEDLVQEVMIMLLEDWEKWNEVRNNSTSSTLMYISLKNKATKVYHKEIKKQMPYPKQTLDKAIQDGLIAADGFVYDCYENDLNNKQKQYITEEYLNKNNRVKTSIAESIGLSASQRETAELKMKNAARFQLKKEGKIS